MTENAPQSEPPIPAKAGRKPKPPRLTAAQQDWLGRGRDQPGGKLPLFDRDGQAIEPRLIRACMAAGWAEPWFHNPLKPDWLVCRLTDAGRALLAPDAPPAAETEPRPKA